MLSPYTWATPGPGALQEMGRLANMSLGKPSVIWPWVSKNAEMMSVTINSFKIILLPVYAQNQIFALYETQHHILG